MTEQDMKFDIDALFNHLVENLGYDPEDELDWIFSLRSSDLQALVEVAEELDDEFSVQVQDAVEEVDAAGYRSYGNPLLSIGVRGALTATGVKAIVHRVQSVAADRGFVYEGVDCYDPTDDDESSGWLDLDEAILYLKHLNDNGLEANAEVPWAFLILTPDSPCTEEIANDLAEHGFYDTEAFDEADEDGNFGMCVFVAGKNSESELSECCMKISQIAEKHRGSLGGIEFCSHDEFSADTDDLEDE